MSSLPGSIHLPVRYLASVFAHTTNSYKFYWFLAILEYLVDHREGEEIPLDELSIIMISEVWYPVNYFYLSFGKMDKFKEKVVHLRDLGIDKRQHKNTLKNALLAVKRREKGKGIGKINRNRLRNELEELSHDLTQYVPMRFLSSWFREELRKCKEGHKNRIIKELAEDHFNSYYNRLPLYKFKRNENKILIHPEWKEYLLKHYGILKDFTYWHLNKYLEKHNPNVPNIPKKLFQPERQNLGHIKEFWNKYIQLKGNIPCIYSGERVGQGQYAIDHFLPWSYVTHDQIWNLIPAKGEVNSSKRDALPAQKYIKDFTGVHYDAFMTVKEVFTSNKKVMEDYTIFFNDSLQNIEKMSKRTFCERLEKTINSQMEIARNMGYPEGWKYS